MISQAIKSNLMKDIVKFKRILYKTKIDVNIMKINLSLYFKKENYNK